MLQVNIATKKGGFEAIQKKKEEEFRHTNKGQKQEKGLNTSTPICQLCSVAPENIKIKQKETGAFSDADSGPVLEQPARPPRRPLVQASASRPPLKHNHE